MKPHYLLSAFLICLCYNLSSYAQELELKIVGKDSIETRLIETKDYQQTHTSLKSIDQEVKRLYNEFQKEGYLNIDLHKKRLRNDSLYIQKISLHKRYEYLVIHFRPTEISEKILQKLHLKPDHHQFKIPINQTEVFLQQLNQEIANQGKPFTSLNLTKLETKSNQTVEAQLHIDQSNIRRIDSLIVKGYEKFPKSYLKNYIRLRKGQEFNKSKLDKNTEALKNLRFVTVPRNPEVLFTENQTLLYLYLEKKNSNHFEGFLGFSTDEETNKFKIDGDLSLNLTNNLNYGESLQIHYKSSGSDQQEFDAKLKLPYLFKTPIGAELGLNLFKQDSSYTTTTQEAKLNYQLTPKTIFRIGYQTTTSTNLLDEDSPIVGLINESYDSRFFTFGGSYEDLQYNRPLFPIQTAFHLEIGIGKRNREHESSQQQWGDFSGSYILNLDTRNSIYIANKSSLLLSDNYLDNELFRFGGIHSIRGFEENSLRASFYTALQTEYRYLLSSNLYAHSIIDYAHLKNAVRQETNNLYGVGFGLGLQTKAGMLQVDFANGKSDGESFRFENTKVHLSLISTF